MGPRVSLLLDRPVRVLSPVNRRNQHELNVLSGPERTLAPRNSLTVISNVASPRTGTCKSRKELFLAKEKAQGLSRFERHNGRKRI